MRAALRRLPLERAVQVLVALTILAFVAGSSSVAELRDVGLPARWLLLVALLAAAGLLAVARPPGPLPAPAALLTAAAFLELAFVSALWSVDPDLTLKRAASLALLFATAGLLAVALAGRPGGVRGVLDAILVGASTAALAGIPVALWRSDAAFVDATVETPRRFQGIGGNPNTVSMLLALALAPALLALSRAGSPRGRAVAGAAVAILAASIVASGSRGALVAAAVAALAFVVVGLPGRARVAGSAAVVAGFVIALVLVQLPQPLDQAPEARRGADVEPPRYLDAELHRRLVDDIGHPGYRATGVVVRRTLFGSSGRAQAWEGAIEQGLERPVAGYGFGTEGKAFVDRYLTFFGSLPENSYIGLFLQLGVLGLALFIAVPVLLLAVALRSLRRLDGGTRATVAACAAVVVGGLAVAVVQSYVYSVGNVATVPLWIAAFLIPAVAARKGAP